MNDKQTNHIGSVKACIRVAKLPENRAVWDGKPPLAFEADLATLTTDYATVIDTALLRNPKDRYADAGKLLAALPKE
jgi:hypothetical protein